MRRLVVAGSGALGALLILVGGLVWLPASASGTEGSGPRVLDRGGSRHAGTSCPTGATRSSTSASPVPRRRSRRSSTSATRATGAKPMTDQPGPSADNDGIPGPLIKARVGDRIIVHFKNLDNEFERPHSMHFHGVRYEFGSDGAYIPGFSGPGGNVKPGDSWTYRLEAGRGIGRRLAVSRPLTVDVRFDRRRALRRALDPGPRRGAAGSRVRRLLRGAPRLQDGERPRIRREHAGLPGEGRRGRAVGRARDRRPPSHLPRARPPLADPAWAPRTRARSARPRASPCAGARTSPERGSSTATSRIT